MNGVSFILVRCYALVFIFSVMLLFEIAWSIIVDVLHVFSYVASFVVM